MQHRPVSSRLRRLPGTGILPFVMALLMIAGSPAQSANRTLQSKDYIATLGEVSALSDPRALRAHQVFESLSRVTDRIAGAKARLIIVNSETKPWAIALPDGGIVLSKGALEICYSDGDELGDSRVAFVLGHELSHLTAGDFWHQNVHLEFANQTDNVDIERIRETLATAAGVSSNADINDFLVRLRERELAADDNGFLIAAVAGYNVAALVNEQGNSFLHKWVRETASYRDISHFSADERTAFLAKRFQRLQNQSLLFDAGIRLGLSDHTGEALALLHQFESVFPSKHVMNSLGFLYLRASIESMSPNAGTRWWFPVIGSLQTPTGLKTRSIKAIGEKTKKLLARAQKHLNAAILSDEHFVPARLNLATVEYFLGNPHAARAHIEAVLAVQPDNADALAIQGPLLLAQNPGIDLSQAALALLEKLALSPDANDSTRYNYARLLDETGRTPEAVKIWNDFVAHKVNLPEAYERAVCEKLGLPGNCTMGTSQLTPVGQKPAIPPGSNINSDSNRRHLSNALRRSFDTSDGKQLDVFRNAGGDIVVAINQVVVFSSSRQTHDREPLMLPRGALKSRATISLANARVHQIDDSISVVSDGPLVKEVWHYLTQ